MKKLLAIVIALIAAYVIYIGVSLMSLPPVSDLQQRKTNMTIQVIMGRFDIR